MSNGTSESALFYASLGWRIVPLHSAVVAGLCSCKKKRDCPAPGKHPRMNDWGEAASSDEDVIAEWLERWPEMNVGLLLGPNSGVVDIEYDTEQGRRTADRLLGEAFTPTYRSSRSTHRLFRWTDDLPRLSIVKLSGLEVRLGSGGKALQSVLPPSRHGSGAYYEWVDGLSPRDVDLADVPDDIVRRIWNEQDNGAQQQRAPLTALESQTLKEGERNDELHRLACRLARRSEHVLEDPDEMTYLFDLVWGANVAKSRPPLDTEEVRRLVASAVEFVRSHPRSEGSPQSYTVHGLSFTDGFWGPGDWRLYVVRSDPVSYRLVVPAWRELTHDKTGTVVLSVDEYDSPPKMARAVLSQTGKVVLRDKPGIWDRIWNGKAKGPDAQRGLKAVLVDKSEWADAAPTQKKYVQMAEYLLHKMSAADAPEDDEPTETGIVRRKDGTHWFRWSKVWEAALLVGTASRNDLRPFQDRVGLTKDDFKLWPTSGSPRLRYCVLQPEHLQRLQMMVEDNG